MPRLSDRKRLLKALERELICRNKAAKIHKRDAALVAELCNEFGVGLPSGAESTGSYEEMNDPQDQILKPDSNRRLASLDLGLEEKANSDNNATNDEGTSERGI